MTVSVWQESAPPPAEVDHDVVVVGAGLVGSYTAGLISASGRDVALVEGRYLAAGASGRNAGMVLVGTRDTYAEAVERFGADEAREIWTLTVENVRRMREIAARSGVEHEESGATYIASDPSYAAALRESAMMLQRDGFDAEFTDRDPLERGFGAALLQPSDFGTQPAQLTQALVAESGAVLYENDEVFDVSRNGAGLRVRARQHVIRCEKVVLALNAYAALFHPFFERYVEPGRGQVLVTQPLPPMVETLALHQRESYFRQLDDGRLLIGGGRLQFEDEERTFSDEVTPNVQGYLARYLERYFPEVTLEGSRRWAGIHGITEDGLPIIGSLPDEREVYFAVGFTGHGNSLGLMAGERVAELALNGTDPGVFNVDRLY